MSKCRVVEVTSVITGKKDIHILAADTADESAARRSAAEDAALDKQWFQTHPGVTRRVRLASRDERVAYGLPLFARMAVTLGPDGGQSRQPMKPETLVG